MIQWHLIPSPCCMLITSTSFWNIFITQKGNPLISHSLSFETTNLFSVSMDLCILDTSCKWNHTIRGLLCVASFTQHNVFKVCPRRGTHTHQYFIPFYSWIIFHWMDIPCLVYLLMSWWHLGCFHLWAIVHGYLLCFWTPGRSGTGLANITPQPPSQCQDLKYLWNKWKFRLHCLSRRDRAKVVGCTCNLCKINCFQHCSNRARRGSYANSKNKNHTKKITHQIWNQMAWVQILALPLTNSEKLFEPPYP